MSAAGYERWMDERWERYARATEGDDPGCSYCGGEPGYDDCARCADPGRASDSFVFATVEPEWYDVRYHVPRSQVWAGSRGAQQGHVHLHVKEPFSLGRIHRTIGQPLCGKRGWYERPLDELEIATACPRCAAIESRRRAAVRVEGDAEAET